MMFLFFKILELIVMSQLKSEKFVFALALQIQTWSEYKIWINSLPRSVALPYSNDLEIIRKCESNRTSIDIDNAVAGWNYFWLSSTNTCGWNVQPFDYHQKKNRNYFSQKTRLHQPEMWNSFNNKLSPISFH